MSNKQIVIIGGGPAGLMAAVSASQLGKQVILVEKNNQIGKKLEITGGGRCNVTNRCEPSEIIAKTVTNGKFLYNTLNQFSSKDVINLLENNGVKLKVEEGGKVFPVSDQSREIIDAFLRILEQNKARILLNQKVDRILIEDDRVKGIALSNDRVITGRSVVVATGGMSYPHTGSTGDGYELAKQVGHTIVPIKPSLVPLVLQEGWIKDMMGISLPHVRITYKISKNKKIQSFGPLLFTHYGISGPAVLELSAYLNKYIVKGEKLKLQIDLVPQFSVEELERILMQGDQMQKGLTIKTLLAQWIPKNLGSKIIQLIQIDDNASLQHITKKDRLKLIEYLKHLDFNVLGMRSIREGIVTSGGVNVKEIDPKTMESKIIKGLFFVGEVLDVDALTGGYNLQIAFSTGYTAGKNV